ncbi:MAG: DUF4282 domain-containing protein [Armatimonadota bacterium]
MAKQNDADWESAKEFISMNTMLTGKLMRTSYIIGQIFVVLFAFNMFGNNGAVPAVIFAIFASLVWRILCEFFIITFAIHEELVKIRKALAGREQTDAGDQQPAQVVMASPTVTPTDVP